jgi:hypothetical protein
MWSGRFEHREAKGGNMGKIVAVLSKERKSGKSVVTYMLANHIKQMAGNHLKILVCCLNFNYSVLYKLFKIKVSDVGLEDLVNYQFAEGSKSDVLSSITPISEGIYFLGSYKATDSYVHKNLEKYAELIDALQQNFDLIVFDTVSEKENILSNLVRQKADTVLNLFVQDNESMKELENTRDDSKICTQETIHMVSKYRNIYPRLNDIKRRYSLKEVYTVDYCETLQEMKNRDSLNLYLQRETSCNRSVQSISKHIIEALCLMPEDSIVKEKPEGYMKSLIKAIHRL